MVVSGAARRNAAVRRRAAILADALIFSAFALHHSIFARDGVKRAVARLVPGALLRSMYVWTASVLLIIVCVLWRRIGGNIYHVEGAPALANVAVQLLGVYLIARSVAGLDPLELAGIHAQAQNGGLQITGPYRLVRHPVVSRMGAGLVRTPAHDRRPARFRANQHDLL